MTKKTKKEKSPKQESLKLRDNFGNSYTVPIDLLSKKDRADAAKLEKDLLARQKEDEIEMAAWSSLTKAFDDTIKVKLDLSKLFVGEVKYELPAGTKDEAYDFVVDNADSFSFNHRYLVSFNSKVKEEAAKRFDLLYKGLVQASKKFGHPLKDYLKSALTQGAEYGDNYDSSWKVSWPYVKEMLKSKIKDLHNGKKKSSKKEKK